MSPVVGYELSHERNIAQLGCILGGGLILVMCCWTLLELYLYKTGNFIHPMLLVNVISVIVLEVKNKFKLTLPVNVKYSTTVGAAKYLQQLCKHKSNNVSI